MLKKENKEEEIILKKTKVHIFLLRWRPERRVAGPIEPFLFSIFSKLSGATAKAVSETGVAEVAVAQREEEEDLVKLAAVQIINTILLLHEMNYKT